MNTIEYAFRPALLRTHQISYFCDLGRTDGKNIPLGVLADLSVHGVYGLGLVARESLAQDELDCIGKLMRDALASPFQYLEKVFEEVYSNEHSDAVFARLPTVHAYSLRFKALKDEHIDLPRPLIANREARRLWVKDELSSRCNKSFWTLFDDQVPEAIDKDIKDEARELEAA